MQYRTLLAICPLLCTSAMSAAAEGPDVIIGFVDDAREDGRNGTKIGLTASTNACNIGTQAVNWHALPDNRHPAITINLYRMADGRMEQLAASWVKHGFFATNMDDCSGLPEVPMPCQSGSGGNTLRPGCSDYYSEDLNADPSVLGPRSRITNPATGHFDGAQAQDLTGYPNSAPPERILLVEESALTVPNGRYFVEAHYIAADDAMARNSRNNVTYREVAPVLRAGRWVLKNRSSETRLQPAIHAWREEGAQLSEIETDEHGVKTHIIIGSKATPLDGGKFRYDYVVYNMNSDLAVRGLSVPAAGAEPASVGFRAARPGGEIWSSTPWTHRVQAGRVDWSTSTHEQEPNANAIRWGTSYNFWFISPKAPTNTDATLMRFKRGVGPGGQSVVARVTAPTP